MSAASEDEAPPAYRLYTSEQAVERMAPGSDLTAGTLDRLARSKQVECTRLARRIFWTDAQLAALVAYHAANPSAFKQRDERPTPAPDETRKPGHRGRGRDSSAIVADPSPRYLKSLESYR